MFARATLPVGPSGTATMVHKDAIVLGGPTPLVYVVDLPQPDATEGQARAVQVQLGGARDAWIEVRGGDLKPGQQVVVQGNERLRPGAMVRVVERIPVGPGEPQSSTAALTTERTLESPRTAQP
jgi:multidrug efflux pump subunit AcrA (membrane-fusion protein)